MRVGSHLLLQIVYPNGEVFRMPAGGPLEMELENTLAAKLLEKDIGRMRSKAQVVEAFREAFQEVMYEFKDRVANP